MSGIVLEYYSGGSLKSVLDEGRVKYYGWERWSVQIADALVTMHRARKAHLDLKPENIVLDDEDNAVLIDLGGVQFTFEWSYPD